MKNIGYIDDNDAAREAFALSIKLKLNNNHAEWDIVDTKPFVEKEDYRTWILENEISVIITDERLADAPLNDAGDVYSSMLGSDLVKYLRIHFKDYPIYCITNVSITEKLKATLGFFNLILSQREFDNGIDNFVNLFVMSGESWYKDYEKDLSRIGELSEKIATGVAEEGERKELKSLQTRLLIPHATEQVVDRSEYLDELEKTIEKIKEHQNQLLKFLEESK